MKRLCIVTTLIHLLAIAEGASAGDASERAAAAERFFRGVYACGPDAVAELAADDVVISYPIFQELFDKPAIEGRQAVIDFAAGFCKRWADAQITIHEAVTQGDRVVLVWSFQGRSVAQADGKPADNQVRSWGGITLFRFNGEGKIVAEIGEESAPGPVERLTPARDER